MTQESTTKTDATAAPDAVIEEQINALARKYRHIGFAIFGGLLVILSAILCWSAVSGIQNDEVYDPFTGEKVIQDSPK